jgi:hypothetical protein
MMHLYERKLTLAHTLKLYVDGIQNRNVSRAGQIAMRSYVGSQEAIRFRIYKHLSHVVGFVDRTRYPAFVVNAIRACYPDGEGAYTGFVDEHGMPQETSGHLLR